MRTRRFTSQSVVDPEAPPLAQGGTVEVEHQVRVCCSCGEWVSLGNIKDTDLPIAVHPEPQCKLFAEHDLLEYVQILRRSYEATEHG